MRDATTGNDGVAMGSFAMGDGTWTGNTCVAIGNSSLANATSAYQDVAVGTYALQKVTTSNNTTALGHSALKELVSGASNTAVGFGVLRSVTTSSANTLVGHDAGRLITSSDNTGLGCDVMYDLTTGNRNVAIGSGGAGATAGALANGTTASNNVAIGYRTLRDLTTEGSNTVVGYEAGRDITGSQNCCFGQHCGSNITSGVQNLLAGNNSGTYITQLTTGDFNVLLGPYTRTSAAGVDKEIVIGYLVAGKGTRTFMVAADSGVYHAGNTSSWDTVSDERIKKNIVNYTVGLDVINKLQPRNFEYKTEDEIKETSLASVSDVAVVDKPGTQLGFIAQELEKILPDAVHTNEHDIKNVNADSILYHLVNAVKELSAKNTSLETRVATLEAA